ncbi:MAG: hypothetical protein FE78DRAFT_540152 [Acidomyces sp. 'richmondensis']|nr:MAG: hypothetical protein FE78DRAFT_540152 [Acidomyces sp. 'richmondensis']
MALKWKNESKLIFLNLLQKHYLCKVPWENLTQHNSWHRAVNVKPQHLFNKIVHRPGRGGYCMEVNHFYHIVFFSLGFQVYMSGFRIYKGNGRYGGWKHVVYLVTIARTKYLLDGGFGPQGPPRPISVLDGLESFQIEPDQMRRVWVYQYRRVKNGDWTTMYCFTDFEFTPTDVESMSFTPCLNRQTFFTHKVVAVRFTTTLERINNNAGPGSPGDPELRGEINGIITIKNDILKWRKGEQNVVEWKFKNDEERVKALRMYFGIDLD